MSLREKKKQKTAAELMAAIERIVAQKPINKELKQRVAQNKIIKLNTTNVEKEAGKSYNSTKSHKAVLDEIERINTEEADKRRATSAVVDKQKTAVKAKTNKINELKAEIKSKNEEIKTLKLVNQNLHAQLREMTSAMFDKIPQEERENLFDGGLEKKGKSNVIKFKD